MPTNMPAVASPENAQETMKSYRLTSVAVFLPPANEVCGKAMFSQVFVCPWGEGRGEVGCVLKGCVIKGVVEGGCVVKGGVVKGVW